MKKLLLSLVCLFALVALVACGNNEQEKTPAEAEYKLGMGVVVNTASSKDAATAQVDATVATVVLDQEGKIVICRLDAAQNKIKVTDTGTVTVPAEFKTKRELLYDYNMAKYGQSLVGNAKAKEWFEQAEAFEKHVVGMTVADVEAMPVKEVLNAKNETYIISADQALLDAGCTIQIVDFKAAVAKACKDDQGMTFKTSKEFTLGLGVTSANSGSKSATETENGAVQVYSDFAASVVAEGKILASLNDAIQPKFTVSATGALTATYSATKRELKENYNMAKYGQSLVGNAKVIEWYIQSAAFSKHVVGMTAADVEAMPVKDVLNAKNETYTISGDQALLDAGCTMQISGIKTVVAKSVKNAR